MSNLKATYSNSTSKVEHIIEVPLDRNQPLTNSIIALQADINTYLTSILENQKQSSEKVTTVLEDEIEKEKQEEEEEEEDSPMQVDRPELSEEQALKKQKTN